MTAYTRDDHSGTGPGEITRDGCAVEMYAGLGDHGETGIIAAAVPPGARTLLELGSGAGRMTRPLLARGFGVTAVDESPGMLERISGARTVRSSIEDLMLGERFDVVTLTSFLVNTADPVARARLLATCARHVEADGCVVVQRQSDTRDGDLTPGRSWVRDGTTITVVSVDPADEGAVRSCFRYENGGRVWTQTFYSYPLTRKEAEQALNGAGLAVDAWLTDDGSWVRAVPAP